MIYSDGLVIYSKCPQNSICGSPLDYGLDLRADDVKHNANIQFGISTFDHIGQALLAVF
jgi:hypothetical protein